MSPPRCGFIGLGAMGRPMAGHLAAHGLLAVVGNRRVEKADALAAELKVRAAHNASDFANCDVVALCVTADEDVLANVDALAAVMQPRSVVIDHSTVSSTTAQTAATRLAAKGIGFLDAPVSGGVEGAINGKLSIMVGGSVADLDKAHAALQSYGLASPHGRGWCRTGHQGSQSVLVAGIAHAVSEGLALGEKLGLDPERLLPTLGAGAAGSWFLEKRGPTMLRDEFKVGFKLALLHKDLKIVDAMAQAAGTRRDIIQKSLTDYAQLMAEGYGDADISALIRLKRRG